MRKERKSSKNNIEKKIAEEIKKRVFDESERRKHEREARADQKIEIDALSEVSELQQEEVARISEEVRAEYASAEKSPVRRNRLIAISASVLVVACIACVVFFPIRARIEKEAAEKARLESLTLYYQLETAVEQGNAELAKYLLDRGAPMQIKVENPVQGEPGSYSSALYVAAYNERTQIVKLLLSRGADLKVKTGSGMTALDIASERGFQAIVRILGQAIADAYPEGHQVKQLWEKGIPFSQWAFVDCAWKNDRGSVRLFIEGGMDIDAISRRVGSYQFKHELTALSTAALEGNLEMAGLLFSLAPSNDKPDTNEPLEQAVSRERTNVVKFLLESGADADYVPILYALDDLYIAKLLLEFGADVNKGIGDYDRPALIYVLEGRFRGWKKSARKKMVRFLLDNGADVNNQGRSTVSALALARNWGDPDVIAWIQAGLGGE